MVAVCWAQAMQSQLHLQSPQLWRAFPGELRDARALAECCALLSAEEQERAQRFHFERDRRAFVAGRWLARTALSHAHPLAPNEWRFRNNDHGKPATERACELRFNIANCQDLVVCLLARGVEVGVDAEPFARAASIMELAPRVFSEPERAQMAALDEAQQAHRALSLWVLKEAYVKARGLGLALPLRKLSFLFDRGGAIRLSMDADVGDRPERWRFCLLDCADHRVASFVENRTREAERPERLNAEADGLEMWEARPPHGSGTRLEHFSAPRWNSGGD